MMTQGSRCLTKIRTGPSPLPTHSYQLLLTRTIGHFRITSEPDQTHHPHFSVAPSYPPPRTPHPPPPPPTRPTPHPRPWAPRPRAAPPPPEVPGGLRQGARPRRRGGLRGAALPGPPGDAGRGTPPPPEGFGFPFFGRPVFFFSIVWSLCVFGRFDFFFGFLPLLGGLTRGFVPAFLGGLAPLESRKDTLLEPKPPSHQATQIEGAPMFLVR